MDPIRYSASAIQVNFENPQNRSEIGKRVGRMLALTEQAVAGYAPFLPVRLVVFPEFAHAAPIYETAAHVAAIDLMAAFAALSEQQSYCRPECDQGLALDWPP